MNDHGLLDDNFAQSRIELTNQQITEINLEKIFLSDHLDNYRMGFYVLIALAVLSVVGLLLGVAFNPYEVAEEDIVIEGLVLCVLYTLCAVFFSKNPLLAMGLGVGIYICVMAITAIVEPSTLTSGIVIKIVVFMGFYKGMSGFLKAQKSGEKLRKMGVPKEEVELALKKIKAIPRTPRNEEPSN